MRTRTPEDGSTGSFDQNLTPIVTPHTMKNTNHFSRRKSAITAGVSLLFMAVAAGVSYGYIHGSLVIAEDPTATLENIRHDGGLFKTEILGWIVIFILDAIVAWALYHFYASTNRRISLLSSLLRIIYTVFLGFAILNLPQVLTIINNQLADLGILGTSQRVLELLSSFENTWSQGLIIFGLHLMVLGYLAYKAAGTPRVFGILLIIAGMSYSFLHGLKAIYPEMTEVLTGLENILVLPMTVGELGFAIWLIVAGGRKK